MAWPSEQKGDWGGHEVMARFGKVLGHTEVFKAVLRAMGSHGRVHSRGVMW